MRKQAVRELEFIALMALLMSNVALSIDAILPALTDIGTAIRIEDTNSLQLIIMLFFLGLGIGELILGTLSDSLGRKPIVYAGVILFVFASFMCLFASSLMAMLIARIVQGMGLSALRTVSMAIIRDSYSGDKMARIMSFIMAIFILVPMVAPIMGQLILNYLDWRAIFYFQLLIVFISILWFGYRQEETLPKKLRIRFSKHLFSNGLNTFFKQGNTIVYTLVSGLIEGAFILYLSSSRQIFQDQYLLIEEFAYIFAVLSLVLGISTFFNGAMVLKYGMKKLVEGSLYLYSFSSLIYLLAFYNDENPALLTLLLFLFTQFASLGFIVGNLSALAMQPIGHIAGIGAALVSFISMLIGVVFAILVGSFLNNTVLPLFAGFFISGIFSLILLKLRKWDRP